MKLRIILIVLSLFVSSLSSAATGAGIGAINRGQLINQIKADAVARVETVAALRLLSGKASGQLVQLGGYYASGDGGGGPVRRWDAASVCTDDGGACLDPVQAGAGRWIFSVKSTDVATWGGRYDPGTDATNDATIANANARALEKALTFANGGGTVSVSGLLYVGTTAASGLVNVVSLEGADYTLTGGGIIRAMSGMRNVGAGRNLTGWILLQAENLNRVKILNLTIDGNGLNNLAWQASSIMTTLVFERGDDIEICGVTFLNCSGRNVISSGWGDLAAACKRVNLHDCTFRNFGGAIPGNTIQNDHSATYAVWEDSSISNNTFINDNETFTANGYDVCAIEEHIKTGKISGNIIQNVGHGIISAPLEDSVIDNRQKVITGNVIKKARKYGIYLESAQNNVIVSDNSIEMVSDTSLYATECVGIRFDLGDKVTIKNNVITVQKSGTAPTFFGGIYLYSPDATANYGDLKNFKISENTISDFKYGVYLYAGGHSHSSIAITENAINDCEYSVYFSVDAPGVVSSVTIKNNKILSLSSGNAFYLRSGAAWDLFDIIISGNDINIAYLPSYYVTKIGTIENLKVLPIVSTTTTATNPTSGVFSLGTNVIYHTDPAAGGSVGKVPVTIGGGYSAAWAALTAYKKGVWVQASGAKVFECVTSGTSAAVAPTSTTLGELVTDGTVIWRYRAQNAATFKTFGAIAP